MSRKSINTVELCCLAAPEEEGRRTVSLELAQQLAQKSANTYDREGEQHYDLLSALQKSIRGSDENAAVFYLARILEAGDLLFPLPASAGHCGGGHWLSLSPGHPHCESLCGQRLQLGDLPEARIPLADAAVLLATAPKSNSAYLAIAQSLPGRPAGTGPGISPAAAKRPLRRGRPGNQRAALPFTPHDYPRHWVKAAVSPRRHQRPRLLPLRG